MPPLKPNDIAPTEEEDEIIQAGIDLDPDNPEWTEEDFRKARPCSEVHPEFLINPPYVPPELETPEGLEDAIRRSKLQLPMTDPEGWPGGVLPEHVKKIIARRKAEGLPSHEEEMREREKLIAQGVPPQEAVDLALARLKKNKA